VAINAWLAARPDAPWQAARDLGTYFRRAPRAEDLLACREALEGARAGRQH
jgi:hypothetical protein